MRFATLTPKEKRQFLPLSPDFVIELRSPSDRLKPLQTKLWSDIANGVRLGWLLDPANRRAYVYHADGRVEELDNPATLAGDPVLPGFTLDLAPIWEPGL